MSLIKKIAMVAVAATFSMALVALFMFSDLIQSQMLEQSKKTTTQVAKLARSYVESYNDLLTEKLIRLVEKESQSVGQLTELTDSEFVALALVKSSNLEVGRTQVEWFESRDAQLVKEWLTSELTQNSLSQAGLESTHWLKVNGPSQRPMFVMMVNVLMKNASGIPEHITALGIMTTQAFSQLNLTSKGEAETILLVDGAGITYSYPDQRYVGASGASHPLVAKALQNLGSSFSGSFIKNNKEKSFGVIENVQRANLKVIVEASTINTLSLIAQYTAQIIFVFLAIAILTYVLMNYFFERNINIAKLKAASIPKSFQAAMQDGSAEIKIRQDDAPIKVFAQAIAQYLQNPVSLIIGSAQIVESKNQDKKIREELKKMAQTARQVRDFTVALEQMSGAANKTTGLDIIDINPILSQVMSVYRAELVTLKVSCIENFKADLRIRADFDQFKQSLKAMFAGILSILRTTDTSKELELAIEKNGSMAKIIFKVSGVGIANDLRRNFFKPFGVVLADSKMLNLDLALAKSYIESLHGDLQIEGNQYESFYLALQIPSVVHVSSSADVVRACTPSPQVMESTSQPTATDVVSSDLSAQSVMVATTANSVSLEATL